MVGNRSPQIGQVAITSSAGFGGTPWGLSTPISPRAPFKAPIGAPVVTEENTASWLCPDGVERVLTVAQARARGCTRKTLGVSVDDVISSGTDIYQSYAAQQAAEEQADAAAANAAAAQANAAAAAAAAGRSTGTILGIPTNYLVIGGASLAAIALIAVLATKK